MLNSLQMKLSPLQIFSSIYAPNIKPKILYTKEQKAKAVIGKLQSTGHAIEKLPWMFLVVWFCW